MWDETSSFKSLSILLPTLNETFSFTRTIDIILDVCDAADIEEFIVIVCERTLKESLISIDAAKVKTEAAGIPLIVLRQTLPFAGGAVRDGIDAARGSHILMMAPDLETDPYLASEFIRMAKQYPNDMITASRWLRKGAFVGYGKVKLICNRIFQRVFSLIYKTRLTDMTFGYRCTPTSLFKAIAWEEVKHPFFLETILKPLLLGVKVHEIPTVWKARGEGESQNSFWKNFQYFGIAFRARFEPHSSLLKKSDEEHEKIDYKM
jgi:glycosyltransferase involved in cell wall biosynthesis